MSLPAIPALVSALALVTYQATTILVGRARARHRVKPPSTTGPEDFERALRVQQNTLEQLVFFLPTFWLAVLFGDASIAAVLGLIWVGGRIAYAVGYLQAAEKRGPGFGISLLSSVVLWMMAVVGAIRAGL
jgi:glutathione S-transferase